MKVIGVNVRRFSDTVIRAAVAATRKGPSGVELLVENGEFFQTYKLDYQGGEKYPHLERDSTKKDRLEEIFKPLATDTK